MLKKTVFPAIIILCAVFYSNPDMTVWAESRPEKNREKPPKNEKNEEKPALSDEAAKQADLDFCRNELVKYENELAALKDTLIMIGPPFLSRPTDRSININVMFNNGAEIYFQYGNNSGSYTHKTAVITCPADRPVNTVLEGLEADTRYYYRLYFRSAGRGEFTATDEYSFHTARPKGSGFVFAVQADMHLDINSSFEVCKTTFANMKAARPDFLIDLGDTFLTEKYARTAREVELCYMRNRCHFFSLVSAETSLFLVIGNHEGENGWTLNKNNGDNLAYWAMKSRKLYYPGPTPGDFYSGCTDTYKDLGLRESYYSFEWGDVLFIVLDPYWYTKTRGKTREEGWCFTLGKTQYDWLKGVLEKSRAAFKFVFIHHLVGGLDRDGRGGIEAAPCFEWGGHDPDGTETFSKNRPGWEMPVHELLKKYKVDIVFHGHDHQFMKQDLDGIVYQLAPQPGQVRPDDFRDKIAAFGYKQGDFVGGAGYLKVTVASGSVRVEFIRTFLKDIKEHRNGETAYTYTIKK